MFSVYLHSLLDWDLFNIIRHWHKFLYFKWRRIKLSNQGSAILIVLFWITLQTMWLLPIVYKQCDCCQLFTNNVIVANCLQTMWLLPIVYKQCDCYQLFTNNVIVTNCLQTMWLLPIVYKQCDCCQLFTNNVIVANCLQTMWLLPIVSDLYLILLCLI
jgi:hypothetical protein